MRGSHLGMRIPWMGGRCQRGVRTPTGERWPGDDARFASGDANSADGGALSTRSSHAHGRTAARRRCAVRIWGCAVRIWGCELRGCGGVVNAEFARPRANGGQGRCAVRIWGCAVRIWGCELRGWGGVVNAEFARPRANGGQGRCAVRIWGCELRGWGGVVNAEFARPRANGGQGRCAVRIWGCELRGWGGRCQRGVRTPSCERRPGDDARFASGDANSAGGGALSTRSSHALVRTAARRRCAVRIWGCELRGWGGALSTRSSHALVRTAARGDARFASGDANSALASAHELPSSCQAKWYRQQELGHDQVSDEALTRLSAICQCMHQPPRRQPGQIGVA
jgi:hypothetical protein